MDQAGVLREMKRKGSSPIIEQKRYNRNTRVISITSGKGGVGKTNITVNLAYIFSKMGKRILLLDADTGLANIDVILGITPKYNLYHVLNGEKTLSEAVIEGPGGIKILPASSGIPGMAELSKGQKFTLLEEMDGLAEDFDFMLIDTAAGIADNVMYFNMAAREIIVVVSPEPTSLTDAYALIKILYQTYKAKCFKLIVNMVRDSNEATEVYTRLSNAANHFLDLPIEYLGYIPYDQNVSKAVRRQRLLTEIFSDSKASKSMYKIIEKLCLKPPEDYENGTIKFFGRS
ncbi:MAG TPA: MinD/ParA family protein [Anaerolineae bacterium]|nr:MinD/ParA family protein [Anaerolineae bacterium]